MTSLPISSTNTHGESSEVVDPVCGMTISTDDAAGTSEYDGRTFYFCAGECKN